MTERSLFMEALEKATAPERSAYLDATCGGDPALRGRIEALLRSHESADRFLGKLAPQRVAEELAASQTAAESVSGTVPAEAGGEAIEFLAPSDVPGSRGRLGHYEIQEVIGRGGRGVVLRAFDGKLQRVVAIKAISLALAASATARKRFTREAQAAAAVRNDHVVDIHAVEEANGLPYLVMEYVSGQSLQQRLDRGGPLPLAEILRIGMQTASGLAAAHAQGLVHRDVKPANILLENSVERVKITDFGLARSVDDVTLTSSGLAPGTPQYMAPEQAAGEPVDHRADLFSLGSVLYAMCTGRPPFRGDGTMAVLKSVCEDVPRPIQGANIEIPEWLAALIAKLHAKNPAERFQSAAEVAELLGQGLAHLQQPAAPAPATLRSLTLPARRRRWLVAAAALLTLGGGLGVTEATGVTHLTATITRILTSDGTLVVEVDDPEIKVTVEGDGGIAITGPGSQVIKLRPGSYRVTASKDGQAIKNEVVTVTRGDKQVVKVTLEPSGPRVSAFTFTPPPSGSLDRLDPATIPAHERFAWQPKELVAVLGEHRGRQWSNLIDVTFSPDGKLAASCGGDRFVYVWDAATLRLLKMLEGHSADIWRVLFSPDGRRLLSASEDRTARLWDVDTGRELQRFVGHAGRVFAVAFSPDGRQVLTGAADGTMRLWDAASGREDRTVPSTLTVTNNRDIGAGSLRAAIAGAHSGDTIVFAAGLNGQTIALTSDELAIRKSLDIEGPGAGLLAISGNDTYRVFDVINEGLNVTIAGLTVTHGRTSSGQGGGGILNMGSSLTLAGDVLSDNEVLNAVAQGGAVANHNGATLSAIDSRFVGNQAIASRSGGLGFGGAIFDSSIDNQIGATATVNGCTFIDNRAIGGDGGVLSGSGGAFNVGEGAGGAILNETAGTLTVTDSTFTGNQAIAGNGGSGGKFTAVCVVDVALGGAICNSDGAVLVISGSTLSDNLALGGSNAAGSTRGPGRVGNGVGGGLANLGVATVTNSTFDHNRALGGSGDSGGGGFTLVGRGTGGGISSNSFAGSPASLTLSNSTFANNQAVGGAGTTAGTFAGDGVGGGFANFFGSTATVSSCTFTGNQATGGVGASGASGGNGFGGGVYNDGQSSLEVRGSTITDNSATGGAAGLGGSTGLGIGGGMYLATDGSVCLDANTVAHVTHNHASTSDDDIFGSYTICP